MRKKYIIFIVAAIAVIFLLSQIFKNTVIEIVSILFSGIVQAYLFFPVVKPIEERINKKGASIILAFLITTVINASALILFLPILTEQIKSFVMIIPNLFSDLKNFALTYLKDVPFISENLNNESIFAGVKTYFGEFFDGFLKSFSPQKIFSFFSSLLLVPAIVYYLLRDREIFKRQLLFMVPGGVRTPLVYIFKDINSQLKEYIFGEFVVVLFVSVLMGGALLLFGFEYWLILGVIMGVFNIIPYVGPVLGSIPILFFAASQGLKQVGIALVIILAVQQIDNLIVQPRIISASVKIHPLTVLLCVIAGSSLGGFFGMLIAIPAYIVLRIVFKAIYGYFAERKCKKSLFAKI